MASKVSSGGQERECEKREEALPVIDIHGYLGVSTLARAAAEAAAADARG